MKINNFKTVALGLGLVIGTVSFAQKKNVTNAALEYNAYGKAMSKQDMAGAKTALVKAKGFLDLALANEDTKDDPKAHMYNGKVIFGLTELSALPGNDDLKTYQSEASAEQIEKSFEVAKSSKKYKGDVLSFMTAKVSQASRVGEASFKAGDYKTSFMGFASALELQKMAGMDAEEIEQMTKNVDVAAFNAMKGLKENGTPDEALAFADQVLKVSPKNYAVAAEAVNFALAKDDLELADKYFAKADAASPNNAQLHSTMGTIFLGKGNTARAEELLVKAVALDPKDMDAQYNLGVMYLENGQNLSKQADNLPYGDPKAKKLEAQATEQFKKAVTPLEQYLSTDPENAQVLRVVMQVSNKAGDTEKALMYKKRLDAAKAKQ